MATIVRALLTNPDFLLMDEPSEGLAPMLVRDVGRIISQLKSEGLSILLIEQNVPLALRVSDYTYVLHHGEIVHHCSANELAGLLLAKPVQNAVACQDVVYRHLTLQLGEVDPSGRHIVPSYLVADN